MYDLPMLVAPILVLSLGYPKRMAAPRKKLAYEMVVFQETYPELSIETICAAFDKKYEGMKTPLPKEPVQQKEMLDTFRRALRTTYNDDKCEQIIQTAQEEGFITEIQRRFGLHYHAEDHLTPKIIEDLANCGIYPFYSWNKSNQ